MKNNYLLFCAFFLYLFGNAQPYITTSTTQFTQEELVTQVLINSPCAIVENVVGITGIDFGSLNGIGYFENTNPNFPIEDGVILMTAGVNQAPGPNGSPQDSGSWPGDPQLFNYIQSLGIDPGLNSYNDASILEFDFRPLTDSISFNFVFASNEYGTFQCSFSDAFAFFLTNEDTNEVTNLAIVPGTEDPISVITIRDQLYNGSCSSVNPDFFDKYYGTPNGLPNAQSPINFNGHTVLMQAWSYVVPNTQYRMKLVIADRNDSAFNSAVFLEGGSFFIGNADLGDDITIDDGNAVCDSETIELVVDTSPGSTITWFFNGEVIPGETGSTLIVTETGIYGVEISNPDAPDCTITDEITVEFKTSPIVDLGEDILVCGKVFATLDGTPENIDELDEVFYQWFFNGVIIDGATEATLEVTEIGDYTVEVTTSLNCSGSDTISVIISDYTVDLGEDVTLCENASYEIIPVVTGIDPSEATYLWSTGETTFSILVTTSGNYSVEVSYEGCVETDDINVNFRELPIIELGINIIKCADDVVTLNATSSSDVSANVTYTWFYNGGIINNETSSTLDVTEAGIYAVEVNDDGCISTDDIVIEFYANQRCVISQGISPNGDGLNDCLDLLFLDDQLSIVKLSIFNRHGRLVYEQNDYINQWCGQSDNGEVLPTGNYFYVITLQNDPAISGYIYLNK